MIDLAIVGQDWDLAGSEEFQFGWARLERQLRAGCAQLMMAPARGDLWSFANQTVRDHPGLPDRATVLLVRHPHALMAPDCLNRLVQALESDGSAGASGVSVVQGSDSSMPWAPPDYCTVRGMERYSHAIPADLTLDTELRPDALITLARAGWLRQSPDQANQRAKLAPGAFAHDFSAYHLGNREEVIPLIPEGARRILDVGGGAGRFLQTLRSERGCETHLAEFSEQACREAAGRVDRIWQGDFLTTPIDGGFDCITFLDVLEHAQHPLDWLARAGGLLAPEGCIVASIPNVGHWSVVADLLEGRWDYAPVGIHCVTHLRFFTRHGIEQLFSEAGLVVDRIQATELPAPAWWPATDFGGRLSVDRPSLDAYAYLVRAVQDPRRP